jgi:hypothetical protein
MSQSFTQNDVFLKLGALRSMVAFFGSTVRSATGRKSLILLMKFGNSSAPKMALSFSVNPLDKYFYLA